MEIDINLGKLPQKEKGSLELIECKTIEEKRRHGLERLASGFRTFSHFGFDATGSAFNGTSSVFEITESDGNL